MREIIFDTETTGLSPITGDRLVEIGCVELVNKVETGRSFHAYFNPGRSMPPEAEAVHGLSTAFLSDKPRFADRIDELLTFIGHSPLVAHNAAFDFGFLNHELGHAKRPSICMTRMVDTLPLARARHPGAKHSLDALCTRYGIDRSGRVKHGALLDAQLLAQVYVELTGGRQIGLTLDAKGGGADGDTRRDGRISAASVSRSPARTAREARPHAASADELTRHAEFVRGLKDPLWNRAA